MKNYFSFRVFAICILMLIGFFTIAQEKVQVASQTKTCCSSLDQMSKKIPVIEYTPQIPLKDIEDDMILLSKNDKRVERLIDADTIWFKEIKEGKFRAEKLDRFFAQNVPYDELRYVQIDEKIYYQFFVSEENLIKKYNPKDMDFSIYRGYVLWEAQEDITYVAEKFNNIDAIAKVEIVSQYFVKVFASVEYVINTFGEDYLDPDDGEYPGYFTHLRLRTAPYLPLKSKFSDQLSEDKEYRTPYMRVFDLETGEKQATITMRPNAYPLLPIDFIGNYDDLPAAIYKNLEWVDIPTNEPIRLEVIKIIHPSKFTTRNAVSDGIGVQVYLNAIEVDNDGSQPLNWVIEAWESNYFIQVGAMRDDAGLLKNHNYARMLDKFDISAINDATNITSVEYETFIANTNPTCWEAWYGGCDCIVNYNEIGPKSYNITNNITSANNTKLGGEKDFNSKTWYNDTYDGDVYYTDPGWNWDKGDGYTNYDVVYNTTGITDFKSRLAGNWYVVGIKDKTEDDSNSTWWQGIETLNANSSLRVTFIPICGDTDLGTITPTSCTWQGAAYNAGTKPYWKFYASSSSYYNFNLCSNSEDTRIRIYDSFNNEVANADDNGPFCSGLASSISWSPTTSGTYYISAAHWSCNVMTNAGTMYYSQSNNPWMRKSTITPTETWQTSVNTVAEINFWTFSATAGTAYAFNFCDISEDTYIRIYDNTWTQQAFNDDNGPCCSGSASSTVWTCTASGTYYIAGMHYNCNAFTTSGNLNYRISTPIANANVSDNLICAGESTTLQGSGTTVCGTIVQYDWDHLAGDNNPQNPVVSPASNTNYQLRILDSNGTWSSWVSVSVVVNPLPIATAGGTQTICVNGTATVSGATSSNGTILWTENGAGSVTAGATSLTPTYTPAAGDAGNTVTLTMTVTSNNACSPQTAQATYTINVEPLPIATAGGSATICPEDTHVVSGAIGEYGTILWSHDGNGSLSNETTLNPTYASVLDGDGNPITLTLIVTSNNTCSPQTAQATYTINVNNLPTAPVIVNSDINNFCENDAGNIIISATGGYGVSTRWFDDACGGNEIGTDNPLSFPSPLVTTTYYARNENTCGVSDCTSKTITVVGQPTVPDEALSNINNFCADNSDNIELSVNGGSGASVQWFTGLCGGASVGTGNPLVIPSPDVTTEYFARWTNACGESDCVSVVVTVNPLPVAPTEALVNRNNFCSNDVDMIELSVNGGSGDDVHWFTGACTGIEIGTGNPLIIAPPLTATTYYGRWQNSCGASVCQNVTVVVTASDDATINPVGPFCLSSAPVVVTAAQTGGTWSGNGIHPSTGLFNPSTAGVGEHVIIYTISSTCGDSDQITIVVIESFDATIDVIEPLCQNDEPVTLSAATDGGVWSGNGITDTNSGVFDPTIAGAGNHTITYEYTGECGDSDNIVIVVLPSADATINTVGPFCEDAEPITLTAAQDGGAWSGNGITNASAGVFNPIFAGVGDHIITYTIAGACGDSNQITISIIEYFDATITSGLDFCYRDSTALLTVATVGGTWEGADIVVSGDETYLNLIDIGPGNYEIIYHYDGLCGNADTVNITIYPLVDATIAPIDTLTEQDNPVQLVAAQDGGNWNGVFVDIFGIFNPKEAGVAEHQVIYTIDGFCGDADTAKIIVIAAPISDLRVPTVITPDNDGYNDTWKIQGIEAYENVSINIFTRWGDEVFTYNGSGENYTNSLIQWNGKKNNKDLPTGSYVYVLILNNDATYKGTISLIR